MLENHRYLNPNEIDPSEQSVRQRLSENLFPTRALSPQYTGLSAEDRADGYMGTLDKNKDGKLDIGELGLAPDYLKEESQIIAKRFERVANLSNDDWGSEKNLSKEDLTAYFQSNIYKITQLTGAEKEIASELSTALENGDFDDFLVSMRRLHGKPDLAKVVLRPLAGVIDEIGYRGAYEVVGNSCYLSVRRYELTIGSSGTADIPRASRGSGTARDAFKALSAPFKDR